jgi:hypothetical protein
MAIQRGRQRAILFEGHHWMRLVVYAHVHPCRHDIACLP